MSFLKSGKYILITGGAGYIGSNLSLELLKNREKVIILDNFVNSKKKRIMGLKKIFKKNLFIEKLDLKDQKKLNTIFKKYNVGIVYHLAALRSVPESILNKKSYINNNLKTTRNLLKSMEKFNVTNLIFASSATVYGNNKRYPFTEKQIGKPTCPYGETKIKSEKLIKKYSNKKNFLLKSVVLRYFNPIGANTDYRLVDDPKKKEDTLMNNISISIKTKKSISIYGNNFKTKDGTCIRDFIHIKDIVTGHIKCSKLLNGNIRYNVINLGSGKLRTVLDLIRIFEKVSRAKLKIFFKQKRQGDVPISIANITKAKKILNWHPKHSLECMCLSHWENIK